MPYTIPSSTISPGTVYQPRGGLPGVIKSNARAIYATGGTAFNSTRMLDLLPSHNGTRRTGEEGRCYTADGTDDEVNFGNIGSAIWFSGWVRLNSDNQCLFSLSNDTNTNLIVSAGVLTAGATLTLSAIKIDDVSKTASEAGVLLNDNAWHFLSCGIGDGLGGGSTADDVRFFTDGTNHGSVSGFDWRFWATTPTASELTEAYSGATANRNSAALSKYALWAKCDEQSGTTAYDSSGNGLAGTLTNITAGTFHATQDIWSFQNQVGYNKRMYFDGVDDYVNFNSFDVDTSGGFEVNLKVYIPDSSVVVNTILHNYSNTSKDVSIQATSGTLRSTVRSSAGAFSKSWDSLTSGFHEIKVNFDGSNLSLFVNDVEYNGTNAVSLSSPTGDQGLVLGRRITGTGTGDRYFQGIISNLTIDVGNTGVLNNLYQGYGNTDADWIDQVGSNNGAVNGTPSNILLPRDESDPTNDVLGNPLTYIGRRPNDAKLNGSNCLTADGTLYIAAAHLTGSETVVSSGGTSTPSISAGRIDFTAGTCWDLTLSDGTHYKLAEGYGTSILDASGNGNHGTLTSATLASAWGATQDDYHSNLVDGSGKRLWFDAINDRVDFTPITFTGDFNLQLSYIWNGNAFTPSAIGYSLSDFGQNQLTSFRARTDSSTTMNFNLLSGTLPAGTLQSVSFKRVSGKFGVYDSNGILITNEVSNSDDWTFAYVGQGRTNSGGKFQGIISNIKIDDGNTGIIDNEYNGYGNTDADWIDQVGSNNGTVNGSPEAFYIPAAPNGLDVFGNELTEKPSDAARNRAETLIDLDPDSTPEMGATQLGITVPASHAFGDAFAASTQIFSRQRTLTEDRIVVMPEAQTGSALATIQRYTQP